MAAPTIVGLIKEKTKHIDHGFFWINCFFIGLNVVGLICNLNLYFIDLYYNGGVLDKVAGQKQKEPEPSKPVAREGMSEETHSLLSEDQT